MLVAAGSAAAEGPPQDPILRINTVQHQGPIFDVTVSPDGSVIATTGADKTIRLWESSTGTLIDTLRIPIGKGIEGVLYALAFTPSGRSLLAGGISGLEWDGQNYLYVLRPAERRMVGRLPIGGVLRRIVYHHGAEGPVIALALSAAEGGAVQIRDARARLLHEDASLPGAPTGIDFAPDGSLVVVVEGGKLRVHAPDFSVRTAKLSGDAPAIARISPDGTTIAIGYFDRPYIDLISMRTLERTGRLAGAVRGSRPGFNALVWAGADGHEIWAGGSVMDSQGRIIVRRWPNPGRPGHYQDLVVAGDTLTVLRPAPDGGVIFASSDPSWGVITPGFRLDYRIGPPGPDYRLVDEGVFAASPDGNRIAFRYDLAGKVGSFVFDIAEQRLVKLGKADIARIRKTFQTPKAPDGLTGWRLSETPEFRGKGLSLRPHERALSVSVRQDGSFILGGDRAVYLFGPDGRKLAERELNAAAFGVLALSDGRFLAALGDGTLRWYAIEADRIVERGALYIARKTLRWVAWLPDGRFSHSDNGGQELAGYHINGGADELASWTDFSQLYHNFYAPEAVMAQLSGREAVAADEPPAASAETTVATAPPPEVKLLELCLMDQGKPGHCFPARLAVRGLGQVEMPDSSPTTAEAQDATEPAFENGVRVVPASVRRVLIRYRITRTAAPIEKIDVFRNGTTTGQTRGLGAIAAPADAKAGEAAGTPQAIEGVREVFLLEGLNTLRLRAYDARGVYGKSAELTLRRLVPGHETLPDLHLLVVGVDDYPESIGALNYARPDAETLARLITEAQPESYDRLTVTELLDDEASRKGIVRAIEELAAKSTPDDSVIVYFAGHGVKDAAGDYHFIPASMSSIAQLGTRSVGQALLTRELSNLKVENLLLVLDTCYSGAFPAAAAGNISNETGFMVLTASTKYEEALDGSGDGQNGVVIHAVREALEGAISSPDGVVDALTLAVYVRKRVRQLAARLDHGQKPQLFIGNSEAPFPVARIGGATAD